MTKPPKSLDIFSSFYSCIVYFQCFLIFLFDIGISLKVLFLIFVLFLQAPLIWKLVSSKYGKIPKLSYLGKKAEHGNLWFFAHKLQEPYETFEFLERFLKTIPGLYSAWLRLWGSRIGEKVNWTSGSKIVDRTHLNIGNRCLIGNMSYLSAHAIKKKDDKYILYVKEIRINDDVVIAYSTTISPGAEIDSKAFIESGAVVYPNQKINEGQTYERFEELLNDKFNFLRKKNKP